ncbi:MAG TPA: DUF5916 domain-containing protein, partial [Myxococcaceae bacterium]
MRRGVWAVAVLVSLGAQAAVEGPGVDQKIQAARAQGPVRVDGHLDEAGWAAAPVFDAFVQRFPDVGAAPSEKTELRVLYDDQHVYIGIVCHDSEPQLIGRQLGRRDSEPASDDVAVLIDGMHDHRTAAWFKVNAGGVLTDGLFFDDRNVTKDWDGVWEGAASIGPDGWVAEMAIPLSLIHFPEAPVQTWGFSVRRNILRRHEQDETVLNPRSSNAIVSRLGHLTGMEGLHSRHTVDLLPYAAARAVRRPMFAIDYWQNPDGTRRLTDPSLDVGLDLKTRLTSDLSLVGTLNPDFGQVEADQIILNLSTFESFFPEKRPFFTQGMELFQPVGGGPGDVPFAQFYSRRVGLDGAPIFGAAKVTGTVGKLQVGLLDAVTMGPSVSHVDENAPDTRYGLNLEQPLHLAPHDSLAIVVPPPTNFFAAVARMKVSQGSRVGLVATSAIPIAPVCGADQYRLDDMSQTTYDPPSHVYDRLIPSSCYGRSGHSLGVDFDLNTDDAVYAVRGTVVGSMVGRTIEQRVLRDGVVLSSGDLGLGAYVGAGKLGGNGFRWDVNWEYASPKLELNPTGFLRTANYHMPRIGLHYVQPDGWGPLKEFFANVNAGGRWTTDERHLSRGAWVNFNMSLTFPSFDFAGLETGADFGGVNVREISRTGVPEEIQGTQFCALFVGTNPERLFSLEGFAAVGFHDQAGTSPRQIGWSGNFNLGFHPHPAVETRLEISTDRSPMAARWVDYDFDPTAPGARPIEQDTFYFGDLDSNSLSFTLRQSVVIAPNLTIQAYAQLFSDYALYGPFYEASPNANRDALDFADLRPSAWPDYYSFYETQMNLNVVARWEYQPGSTLYAIYTRHQLGAFQPQGPDITRTV